MLNKAVEFDKSDDEPLRLRGQEYFKLKKYKQAVDDYTQAIEIAPNTSSNYQARSLAYEKLGQKSMAQKDQSKRKG